MTTLFKRRQLQKRCRFSSSAYMFARTCSLREHASGFKRGKTERLCRQRETKLVSAIPFADLPDHVPKPIGFAALKDLEGGGSAEVLNRLVPPSL